MMNLDKVSRLEVIDENGRSYVKYFKPEEMQIDLSFQDNSRTLKIFIGKNRKNCEHEYRKQTDYSVCVKCGDMY